MIFVLVTTTQLILVIAGVLTAHLIWNNPPDCPEKYKKLGEDLIKEEMIIQSPFGYSTTRAVSIREFCDWLQNKINQFL